MNNLFLEFKNGSIVIEPNVMLYFKKGNDCISVFRDKEHYGDIELKEVKKVVLETAISKQVIYEDGLYIDFEF